MPASLGWIRQFHKPRSADCPPLLICPHAGAGASAYRAFSKALSAHFDVQLLQYPGRQDRAAEPAAATLPEMAAGALEGYLSAPQHRDAPLTLFGHSMGAIVAFEFVRLAETSGVDVRLLAASSAAAPGRIADLPGHPTTDEELLDHLAALNGTDADVMANRDVMRMALPVMKADYRAFDAYSCAADVRVDVPLQVLGGDEDPFVTPRDLYAWSAHTSADLEVTLFAGGHFYIADHIDGIAELLVPQTSTVA
ncbi:thioesterase II family protein [Nocardia sp. CWNU-33]|uniref:thioesterase II family protein n=1 Tax=Nocardia sp. CWNU-33 TaxID=3392117 RepID=UPI00398E510E